MRASRLALALLLGQTVACGPPPGEASGSAIQEPAPASEPAEQAAPYAAPSQPSDRATAQPSANQPGAEEPEAPGAPGHPSSARATDPGVDPCSLLRRAEVEPLFGTRGSEGARAGNVCRWKPDSGPGSLVIQVNADGRRVYAHEKDLLGADEELSGLGDEAFRSGLIVGVRAGELWVSIGVAPNIGKKTARPDEAVALARLAIGRLP